MTIAIFLSGMATMGFVVAGLFFFRFWWRTKEQLFLAFGIAFWLLAVNQTAITLSGIPREELSSFFMLRVLAFGLLIWGIVAKNLGSRNS